MNRRQFLLQLNAYLATYGLSSLMSDSVFGATTSFQRFIWIHIDRGGADMEGSFSDNKGNGNWTMGRALSPLNSYASRIALPRGLNSETQYENGHNRYIQAGTEAKMAGNLGAGQGRSVDLIIGEHLKSQYKTAEKHFCLGTQGGRTASCTVDGKSESGERKDVMAHGLWGTDDNPSINTLIYQALNCASFDNGENLTAMLKSSEQRLAVIENIKNNTRLFSSKYLINHREVEKLESQAQTEKQRLTALIQKLKGGSGEDLTPALCNSIDFSEADFNLQQQVYPNGQKDKSFMVGDAETALRVKKLVNDSIIDLFKFNVTRSISLTYHDFLLDGIDRHNLSHYRSSEPDGDEEVDNSSAQIQRERNQLSSHLNYCVLGVKDLLDKLDAANLLDGTVVVVNSEMSNPDEHRGMNHPFLVVNAGVSGEKGSRGQARPVSDLMVDLLRRFGLNYTQFGSSTNKRGVGRGGILG